MAYLYICVIFVYRIEKERKNNFGFSFFFIEIIPLLKKYIIKGISLCE